MKVKKIAIFLIIICVILSIGIIIIMQDVKNKDETMRSDIGDPGEIIDYKSETSKKVTDYIKFYTVVNCVNTYLSKININNTNYYERDGNNSYRITITEETINENIYDLLSKEYIEDKGITVENLKDKVKVLEEQAVFVPLKMNMLVNYNVDKYVTYGFLTDINSNFIKKSYFYVNIDKVNNTFSIEPIDKNDINDIEEIEIINNNETIEKNEINKVNNAKVDNEYLCRNYIDIYKRMLIAFPELGYEYLDNEYKEKRFGSYERFEKYIKDNMAYIKTIYLNDYLVEYHDNYTEYIIKDKYGNLYIFDEKGVLDFSLKLDTYTIATDKFKETYNSSKDTYKCQMNIDKFFQMINRQDYKTSYECLAESYKNNYFKTEESFESYVKNNFFTYNKVSYENVEQKGDKLYVFTIELTDLTEENTESKEVTIVMQLNEDLNFEMSFSM